MKCTYRCFKTSITSCVINVSINETYFGGGATLRGVLGHIRGAAARCNDREPNKCWTDSARVQSVATDCRPLVSHERGGFKRRALADRVGAGRVSSALDRVRIGADDDRRAGRRAESKVVSDGTLTFRGTYSCHATFCRATPAYSKIANAEICPGNSFSVSKALLSGINFHCWTACGLMPYFSASAL